MPASPLDSAIYRDLLGDAEVGRLFTDTAEVRAMLLVEGALAEVQGEMGLIPETAAKAIHRAALELQIDPGALAAETGRNAVPVPALVAAFRAEMKAPEHAQYVHWGATSQDIMDTALMLRLRRVLEIAEARLDAVLAASPRWPRPMPTCRWPPAPTGRWPRPRASAPWRRAGAGRFWTSGPILPRSGRACWS
jgi:3-carboxy-cis,cis-muconate cycloisomerase